MTEKKVIEKFHLYQFFFLLSIGGILGFISGVVGIGGGIFFKSNFIFNKSSGRPKHIITVASLFILINSISGIIGQLTKNIVVIEIQNYWYLLNCCFNWW